MPELVVYPTPQAEETPDLEAKEAA
jgi:hypothetical protein